MEGRKERWKEGRKEGGKEERMEGRKETRRISPLHGERSSEKLATFEINSRSPQKQLVQTY